MRDQANRAQASKTKLGQALVWLGSLVFFGESWLLIAQANEFWKGSGAATLGWMAGLGALAQRALSVLVWNQGLLFAALAKVLVLCCPLVLVFVGIVIVRSMTSGAEGTSMKGAPASIEGENR